MRRRGSDPALEKEIDSFSKHLLRRRTEMSLTLADVSRATGLSPSGLNRLECGDRTPTLKTLLLLTRAYRMKIVIRDGKVREEP